MDTQGNIEMEDAVESAPPGAAWPGLGTLVAGPVYISCRSESIVAGPECLRIYHD